MLDRSDAPVEKHSSAEVSMVLRQAATLMELDGEAREVGPADAILIAARLFH